MALSNAISKHYSLNEIRVNKLLVDSGVAVNLTPQSLIKKIEKCDTNMKPHNNIVLSIYW